MGLLRHSEVSFGQVHSLAYLAQTKGNILKFEFILCYSKQSFIDIGIRLANSSDEFDHRCTKVDSFVLWKIDSCTYGKNVQNIYVQMYSIDNIHHYPIIRYISFYINLLDVSVF